MIYKEFNKRVFQLYVSRSSSSFAIFNFDAEELSSIVHLTEIKRFEILRSDWQYLLKDFDGVPQYFGLLAIQCCAASMMERSDAVTSNAYQLRLIRLLGLKDEVELQQLFKQEVSGRPVQEVIWDRAKRFLAERFKQDLNIPNPTTKAGRYVRYPKWQALFNTEELKQFTVFFSQTFQVGESLSFSYFETTLLATILNIKLTSRMKELLDDQRKKALCVKQVFNYYNRWNGEVYSLQKQQPVLAVKEVVAINLFSKLILIIENDSPAFYLPPENKKIPITNILSVKRYRYFYKALQIFSEIPGSDQEYEHSRFIFKNTPCYLIVSDRPTTSILDFLKGSSTAVVIHYENGLFIFRYQPSEATAQSPLGNYLQNKLPITLSRGLRLKEKIYLAGYGPHITGDYDYNVLFENAPCMYDAFRAMPGEYIVRISDHKDIRFNIIGPVQSEEIILPKNRGWNFASLSVGNNPLLEGCLLTNTRDNSAIPLIREWILSIQQKSPNNNHAYNKNALLRAIKNAKL